MKREFKLNKVKVKFELLLIFMFVAIILNVLSCNSYAVTKKITVKNATEFTNAISNAKKNATKNNVYEITLSSGNYTLESGIAIPSYTDILTTKGTTININGQITMNANSSLSLIGSTFNYTGKSSSYAVYVKPGANNVKISNGTIKGGGIYIKQAKNINVNSISIKGYKENGIYALESSLKAVKSITCQGGETGIFFKLSSADEINACNISSFSSTGIELYTGCSIKGNISNNKIFNGKGTAILLTGPTNKINGSVARDIINNNIKNCTGDGIGIYHASHCGVISNNYLDTIGGNHNGNEGDYGIIVDSMMKANTYCTQISKNTVKNVTYAGIAVYSGPSASLSNIYQDTAYVEKNIENNVLENCGTYKPSKNWEKEVKKGCLSGIYVDTHARVKGNICNNTVKGTGEHGIYVHLCSFVKNIYNNTVENTVEVGIEIYHSTVTGNIYNNVIKNAGTDGIACGDVSTVKGKVYNNKISSSKQCGIYLTNSKVKTIEKNTISGAKKEGIYIRDKSTVQNINNNKVSINNYKTGCGIKDVDNSKVNNIAKNTITGKMVYGIRIVKSSSNVSITGNKITTSNPSGKLFTIIFIDGDKSKTFNIKNNTASGNKTNYGIRIDNGKANIINNEVSKATYPIYIKSNKYAVKLQNNTLKSNEKNIIKVNTKYFDIKPVTLSSVRNISKGKIEIRWKKSSGMTNYEIYQATSNKGNYKKINTLKNNRCTVSKLSKGKTYYYKVCGYTKYGSVTVYNNYSSIKQAKVQK